MAESPDFGNASGENVQIFHEFLEKMTENKGTDALDFFCENLGREKNVEFVDLVKRFPTRI